MKLIGSLIKLAVFLACFPVIVVYSSSFFDLLMEFKKFDVRQQMFVYGLLAYLPVHLMIRKSDFLFTFEHEMTHILFAKLFFKKIDSLKVTNTSGGLVRFFGGGNFLIFLGPYFFPTFAYFAIFIGYFIKAEYTTYMLAIVGFLTAYQIISTIVESTPNQPDIKGEGYIFSYVFMVAMNILCYGTVLALVNHGYYAIIPFLSDGVDKSVSFAMEIWEGYVMEWVS